MAGVPRCSCFLGCWTSEPPRCSCPVYVKKTRGFLKELLFVLEEPLGWQGAVVSRAIGTANGPSPFPLNPNMGIFLKWWQELVFEWLFTAFGGAGEELLLVGGGSQGQLAAGAELSRTPRGPHL